MVNYRNKFTLPVGGALAKSVNAVLIEGLGIRDY